MPYSTAAEVEGRVWLGVRGSRTQYGRPSSRLLSFDIDGNLKWVKAIDTNLVNYGRVISFIGKATDSTFYVGQGVGNNDSSSLENYLLEYDTAYNEVGRRKFLGPVESSALVDVRELGDTMIIVGVVVDTSISSLINLYNGDSLVNSKVVDHGWETITSLERFGNNYVFGYNRSDNPYLSITDLNLSQDTTYFRAFNNKFSREYSDFIVSRNKRYLYAIGIFKSQSFSVIKYDRSFNEVSLDTLRSEWDYMFSKSKFCDYLSADSIFMVGGMGVSEVYYLLDDDSIEAPLQVVLADTSGNFHWSRTVGQKDSAYYYPWTVCATSDGGALIFSGKYDWRHTMDPHFFLSVIKIQANGDVVSENEYPIANGKPLEVFPNPAKEYLNFEAPDDKTPKSYVIFDLKGGVMEQSALEPEQQRISISPLKPGLYFFRIEDAEGNSYLGRFVKE